MIYNADAILAGNFEALEQKISIAVTVLEDYYCLVQIENDARENSTDSYDHLCNIPSSSFENIGITKFTQLTTAKKNL